MFLIVLLLISIPLCKSETICEKLIPFHGSVRSRPTVSPFYLVTSPSTVNQNGKIHIQIKSVLPELRFGGFLMQARSTSSYPNRVIGKFASSIDGLKLINCDGVNSTASYDLSPNSVSDIELQWQAPNEFFGEIYFIATIAQQNDEFWVRIKSAPVQVIEKNAEKFSLKRPNGADSLSLVKSEQRNSNLIYEGCGTTKTCIGLPNNCVEQQSCQAIVTAVVIGNQYQFELQSGVANVRYVALGLSRNAQMGDASVMECIPEEGIIRTYSSWNNARGNTREGVPQNITTLIDSSYVEGTIYCKLEREPVTTVLGTEFDLLNENFHFLIAVGSSVTDSSVTRHDIGRIATSEPIDLNGDPIYDGCGLTKTCFGLPNNCVEQKSCQAIVTAVLIGDRYQFELQSDAANVRYVALGLSRNNQMDDDSVMECIPENGVIRTYSSYNARRGNTREGVPQNITFLLNSSYVDGKIYCKLEREPVTTVLENEFDLGRERYYFLVAIGTTVTDSAITRHDINRIPSSEPVDIIRENVGDPIYEGCGTTKTCFGLPNGCVEEQSCQAIATAVILYNRYEFELKSSADRVGYVALGLSRDDIMGDDSVMECIPEGGIIRTFSSWNNPRPTIGNTRFDVPQNITSLIDSSYIDGTIYCKLERQSFTTILRNEFNLRNENFHFMVAIGTTVAASALTRHDLGRIASSEPLEIVGEFISDPIYEGCGTNKTCFGLPINCVEQQSCQAIATAVFVDNRYQFELKTGIDRVGYVALGLSRDNEMGDDSVMECVPEGGVIRSYSSWNNPRPSLGNTRQGVPQDITTLINSSYVDGTIYCKLERQSLTTVLGNEFNLQNERYHFVIAIGTTVTASSLTRHDLGRIASSEPLEFIGNGQVTLKMSAIVVLVGLLATNCLHWL